MNHTTNVLKIVESYLMANGYDGLVASCGECSCLVGDLAPCTAFIGECLAGHRVDDDGWHIVAGRRPSPAPGEAKPI